ARRSTCGLKASAAPSCSPRGWAPAITCCTTASNRRRPLVKNLGRGVAVVLCTLLLARPGLAWADVVPARKAKANRDAAAVEQRLVALGVDGTMARAGAEGL